MSKGGIRPPEGRESLGNPSAGARGPFYVRLSAEVPSAVEEDATAVLWELGTLGSQIFESEPGHLQVHAYFDAGARDGVGKAALALADLGARRVSLVRIGNEDWQAGYREIAQPVAVGERFILDPRQPGKPLLDSQQRFLLHLPARNAFGTGTHPSTQLALRLLEGCSLEGRTVLDFGYGTGVLSFAVLLLGARTVTGIEKELEAALVGGENRALNQLWPHLVAGGGEALKPGARFDVIVANLLSRRLLPVLPRLESLLAEGGELILSGLLKSESNQMVERLRAAGFETQRTLAEEEWAALGAERGS